MLNRRGWDAFRQHSARNVGALPGLVATHLLGQGFIRRRSRSRWLAHQLVFWALVFPLGMYSAATFKMRAAIQLDALEWLPKVAFAAALIAWLAAAFGLVHEGLRAVLARRDRDASDTPRRPSERNGTRREADRNATRNQAVTVWSCARP